MKRGISFIIPVLLIAISLAACRRGGELDSSKLTVETINGVRFVHNRAPQAGGSSPVSLEFVGKIGELEGKKEDILYDPVDAARLPNGDILVLEGKGCDIKRYNSRHEYLSSFGHKGQGPGDFISPFRLLLSADKKRLCIAHDRISWFSIDGDYQSGFQPEIIAEGGTIQEEYREAARAILSGSRVILPSPAAQWVESGRGDLLTIRDETGKALGSFGAIQRYDTPLLTLNANIACIATDDRDHICVAYKYQNRIDGFFPDGRKTFSADRALPYAVKTETRMREFSSGSVKLDFPWPFVTSVTKGVAADGRARIWVLTYLKQPGENDEFGKGETPSECFVFDVFDGDGIWLFQLPFPESWVTNFSICGDRLFVIDARDESCVREYRIVEKN
jgi:hypothetical protein